MYQTTYHRPSSVDEAAAAFAKGSDSKYLAGGHTLIPVMKQRLASPSDVIDLGKIKELIGIEATGDGIMIKAATTHHDVASSATVQKAIPALAYLASLIGDPAVRHRGTIGGSLANVAISDSGLLADLYGSADYRANLIKVMAQRAVTAAG